MTDEEFDTYEEDFDEKKESRNPFIIPASIIAAGLIIAGAFYYSAQLRNANPQGVVETPQEQVAPELRPVSTDDHLRGSPDALITFVEYSDFECPFCGRFHEVMKQIIEKYGKDQTVAWAYRHFPIEELHTKAWREAMASECAAELGGDDAFWKYADLIFENTDGNDGLDLTLLSDFAEQVGVDREAFNACMESERTRKLVEEDYNEASGPAGGTGTPYTVVSFQGQTAPLDGALTFEAVDAIIQTILIQNHLIPAPGQTN